ncbi:MAG: hypothetical protein ACOY5F_08100 [Pseudomonadota bacterium]
MRDLTQRKSAGAVRAHGCLRSGPVPSSRRPRIGRIADTTDCQPVTCRPTRRRINLPGTQ